MSRTRARRDYLDWLRGVAVLLMIEAHLLDSWTAEPDRSGAAYRYALIVGGTGSGLFLFLAGIASALSAGSKWRRHGDRAAAAGAVARRGLEIFLLAFLFRLQAWFVSWSQDPRDLLKVDILNIMGPSIAVAALLWRLFASARARGLLFAGAALFVTLVTPVLRQFPPRWLPDPVEAYLVPVEGLSAFVFFPWIGYVLAGAGLGVLLDAFPDRERRLNLWFGGFGLVLVVAAYAGSHLPSIYPNSRFWTSSPSFFAIQTGILMCGVAAAYAWNAAPAGSGGWGPILQLGRTSLFIYWIHVELVYGLISRPLHRSLSLSQAWTAYAAFTLLMLGCSLLKDHVVRRHHLQRQRPAEVT